MKAAHLVFIVLLAGCNANEQTKKNTNTDTSIIVDEPVAAEKTDTSGNVNREPPKSTAPVKMYANERFKDVTVEKKGEHTFLIKGKGQIFEASFSWVIEDGHEEIKKGFTMTDAGAPEWGNFSFTVDAQKKRANSTLHLILFESSAKDGSRQYELPILLY